MQNQKSSWNKEYKSKGKLFSGYYSIKHIEKHIKKDEPILEVGCGNGKTLIPLLKRGYKIIGIDLSKNAIKNLKKELKKLNMSAKLEVGNILNLPYKNNSFNAVICNYVLEHLLKQEREIAIKEIHRVLRKNGKLFLEEFSINNFRYGKGKEIEQRTFLRGNGILYHYFDENELRELLKEFRTLGFEEIVKKRKILGKEFKSCYFRVVAEK